MRFFLVYESYLWRSWSEDFSFTNVAIAIASVVICAIIIYRQQHRDALYKVPLWSITLILGWGIGYFTKANLGQLNAELSIWLELIIASSLGIVAIAFIFKLPQSSLPQPTPIDRVHPSLTAKDESLQQQIKIRQQEQFIKNIYEDVREAIFVVRVTEKGEFIYQGYNPAAKRLTGIEDVEIKLPRKFLRPKLQPKSKDAIANAYSAKPVLLTKNVCIYRVEIRGG